MRLKRPDSKNASDILEEAEKQMKFTMGIQVNDESAFTIIRNIYECFRMLGDALLVNSGIESTDHLQPISELLKLDVDTRRPTHSIDNLRRLRHNVNYYGYHTKAAEAIDAIDIANACFKPLLDAVRDKAKGAIR